MQHSSPSKPQHPKEWLQLSFSAPAAPVRDFFQFLQAQSPSSPTTISEPPLQAFTSEPPLQASTSEPTLQASTSEPPLQASTSEPPLQAASPSQETCSVSVQQPQVDVIPEVSLPSLEEDQQAQSGPSRHGRARARKSPPPREGWAETIDPPYPWATPRRAVVYSLEDLLSKNIRAISGDVFCRHCKHQYTIEYDLESKFSEISAFIAEEKNKMHHRAVKEWSSPVAQDCKLCGFGKCVVPVISKKRSTNWLFLLLGQMIGFCKLTHLKYFCKHAKVHRTGAKDRLIYLTYLSLCKQLYPDDLFDL